MGLYLGMATKRRTISIILMISLLAGSTGCSWVFMNRLDDDHEPSKVPSCSDWYVWPVIDGLYAASIAATFIGMDSGEFGAGSGNVSFPEVALMLLPAMLYLQSAVVGSMWARECNEAVDEHERWKEEQVRLRIEGSNEPQEGQKP